MDEKNDRRGNNINPRGWVGLGVAVPKKLLEDGVHRWDTVYHGTTANRVCDILGHRHIGMPFDMLPDGVILKGLNSAGRSDTHFYTSPTINYAGLQLYSTAWPYDMGERAGQVVLQCWQNRSGGVAGGNVKELQGETMGFQQCFSRRDSKAVCKYIDLYDDTHGIETTSSRPDLCVPYRVMVRTFPGPNSKDGVQPPDRENHCQGLETFHSPVDPPIRDPRMANTFRYAGGQLSGQWYKSRSYG